MGRVGGHEAKSGGGDRILWVDYAKGIGIALVVIGHVLNGLWSSGILAEDSALKWVRAWIYSFHMHLFFLLSGLFLERQVARPAGMFLADKLRTIAYPYFVWSSLQLAIHSSLRGVTNNTADLGELWTIVYLPTMQFWFLYTLFLLVLGYYVLARFGLGPLAILGVFTAWRQAAGILPTGTWWPLGTVRWYGVYLALGAVLHQYQFSERAARLRTTVLLALSGLGFTAVGLGVSRGWDQGLWSSPGVALCGIVASLGLALTMDRAGGPGFVRLWGRYSLEIYVAHTIVAAGVRVVSRKVLGASDPSAHILMGCLAGLYAPIALAWIGERLHCRFLFRIPAPSSPERADRGGSRDGPDPFAPPTAATNGARGAPLP